MSRITVTIACPEGLIPDANELACLGGHGPADREKLGVDDKERTDAALTGIVGKRLTYKYSQQA